MSKLNINPFFYFLGFLSTITGLFKPFLIMYLIVFIHEIGHITMALIFKYKIKKINIYPFGGYTIFETNINTPFLNEFMVFLGGILFQIIFFLLAKLLLNTTSYTYKLIENYNLSILIFNLIPIIPLDGSKVLNIFLNKIFSFKKSHLLTIYISYITIFIIIIISLKKINLLLMIFLLLALLIKEHKNHKLIFNMFLIERYIKNIRFKKINFINNLNLSYMKKYCKNIFIVNNKYIDEKNVLKNKFHYQ